MKKLLIKKVLIIIVIFFGAIILFGVGYDLFKDWSLKKEINSYPDYYKQLAEKCESNSGNIGPGCCISSVRDMVIGNYKLEPENGCPEGYQRNMLKCIGSYKWCEPIK